MMTRIKLLNALLEFEQPLTDILPALNTFGWDSDQVLIILKKQHIINILQRYLEYQLSSSDVENWANAIEGREDIEYESDYEDLLDKVIYELANPTLTQTLSMNSVQELLTRLINPTLLTY